MVESIEAPQPDFYKQVKAMDGQFEDIYRSATKYPSKHEAAMRLIEDGRYENPMFLIDEFIPRTEPQFKEALDMKADLKLALIKKRGSDFSSTSSDAQDLQDGVLRFIETSELLSNLSGELPIHVMGAITNVLLFQNISDEKKLEELRAYTSRSLLRPYLGDIKVARSKPGTSAAQVLEMIPERIFENPESATLNIIKSFFVNEAMKMFADGEMQGFEKLEQMVEQAKEGGKKIFFQSVLEEFKEIDKTQISSVFRDRIAGWQSDYSPFPNFRQKFFVHEFKKTRRKLLNGDTGATKTACSYLAMESVGAQKVTIFGPARARETWPIEASKLFQDEAKPDVFTVESEKDLDDQRIESAKYVFVGAELMARALNTSPGLREKLSTRLVEDRKTDGIIIDESHTFQGTETNTSRILVELIGGMKRKYSESNSFFELPMVALTATPISSSLEDLDITMGLLYEDRFTLPKEKLNGKTTFSETALKNPKLANTLLSGEKLMIQWTLEDMFGEKAPKLEFQTIPITLSAEEAVIYDWIYKLEEGKIIDALMKIRLLKDVLINPDLIKKTCRNNGLVPDYIPSAEKLEQKLRQYHDSWESWLLEKDPAIEDEPFSAKWIASYAEPEFLLECFFSPELSDGVDALVRRTDLKADWKFRDEKSAKFAHLKHLLKQKFIRNKDGSYSPFEKVFIVSPHHKKGITDALDNPDLTDKEIDDYLGSLYDYIRYEWLDKIAREMVVNIDGDKSFAGRQNEAKNWREEGEKTAIVVSTMESVYESMDWALRDTSRNEKIQRATVIFLGWPWGWDDFKQMSGRFIRPGQAKPVDIHILEAENTIDPGLSDHVRRKHLLSLLALTGIELTPDEQELFDSTRRVRTILDIEKFKGQMFIRNTIRKFMGSDEETLISGMSKETDGKSDFERWADYYFDGGKDEFRIQGNNAELVKNILTRLGTEKILSVGAGTCLLSRKFLQSNYQVEIDNLDINLDELMVARQHFPGIGKVFQGLAQNLSSVFYIDNQGDKKQTEIASNYYDAVDCSFLLPWLSIKEIDSNGKILDTQDIKRVRAITEINRVLKLGGITVFTFPKECFDPEKFANFSKALEEYFGFAILKPTGQSRAIDIKPLKDIGWVITVKKIGLPNLSNLNIADLFFAYDSDYIISKNGKQRQKRRETLVQEEGLFSPKEFEVYNPLTGEISEASSLEDEIRKIIEPKVALTLDEIKQKLVGNPPQRAFWIESRRGIERALEVNYEEAEEILFTFINDRELGNPSEWNEGNFTKIRRILQTEIKKKEQSLVV